MVKCCACGHASRLITFAPMSYLGFPTFDMIMESQMEKKDEIKTEVILGMYRSGNERFLGIRTAHPEFVTVM